MISRKATWLAIAGCGLLTWWLLRSPTSSTGPSLPRGSDEHAAKQQSPVALPQAENELCVNALRTPSTVELRTASSEVANASASANQLFQSYGKLDARAKAEARSRQESILTSLEPQLRDAVEGGHLKQAALVTEGMAVARQALAMLDRDDYLLLDQEVVNKLWPSSPEGWRIVQAHSIQLESGQRPTLVFAFKKSATVYAEGAGAAGNIEWFLAEDAALRFNGLPDDQRGAILTAMDKWNRDEQLDAVEREQLAVLNPILKDRRLIIEQLRIDIDRARMLIHLSKR